MKTDCKVSNNFPPFLFKISLNNTPFSPNFTEEAVINYIANCVQEGDTWIEPEPQSEDT